MNVSLAAVWPNLGILALLFATKMVPKLVGVYPLAAVSPHRTQRSRRCSRRPG